MALRSVQMQLNYQTPPDKDPDREHEPAQWWVLAALLAIGWAVLLTIFYFRFKN